MVPKTSPIIDKAKRLRHPTPFFYTSKKILKHNYETFTGLFENSEIFYAIKANSDPKILSFLNKLGSGFEAASFFEIETLLHIGVNPTKIIYGTAVKPSSHIKLAKKAGINYFAADSKEEIDKIAKYARGANVLIRVVANDTDSVFAFSERFGAPMETAEEIILYAKKAGLNPYGISFHVGSQAVHVEHWSDAILSLVPTLDGLKKHGVFIEAIDIGGGFPVIYNNHKQVPQLGDIATKVHTALNTLPNPPKIMIEPGRGIVATATVMVSEVISRTVRHGKVWLVLDGGIYNCLYEAMIHQGTTQYDVHSVKRLRKDSDSMPCVLSGPTGDSLDIISRDVTLPASMEVGDRLIFENAGAYTLTMASPFNGFPKPKLYLG